MSNSLFEGLSYTMREEGVAHVFPKAKEVVRRNAARLSLAKPHADNSYVDVIFINGCDYSVPHPIRYRVDHQIEQLLAAGYSAYKVEAESLTKDILRHGRMFVIFRCPVTDKVKDFISEAKKLNKTVLYDIDDLVIDTCYTNTIPYVNAMSPVEKAGYDDGVKRMGETLKLCDGAITTTEDLAAELEKYVSRVYVNRNTASETMQNYSDIAVYRRDILPQFDRAEVKKADLKIYDNAVERKALKESNHEVRIGYFSGSITHNDDFELIIAALVTILEKYSNATLLVMGELDLPDRLAPFRARVKAIPFSDWRRLPGIIASCDINIAPLRDTIFNRAKSENKWIEASLVKVPTVASNVGAFKKMIVDGETGYLCDSTDEWIAKLSVLVDSPEARRSIGEKAYSYCTENCTTIGAARTIAGIIGTETKRNVVMVLPSLNTSGGVLVALRHCAMLQGAGYDVTLLSTDNKNRWFTAFGHTFPVLNRTVPSGRMDKCPLSARIDKGVATLWDTVDFINRYPKLSQKYYLVQNYETGFISPGNVLRFGANSTYFDPSLNYLTISKWCEDWLEHKFGHEVRFAANGIDTSVFTPSERDFEEGKIRILIEGDCGSEYKNVDESFLITNQLDPEKYEIWYMSYTGTTKPFYRIDNNLGSVPHEEVANVYRQCHILLKTSKLESFSYPPLEMMATGGFVVARPNEGNSEYLVDGENCLLYSPGNTEEAVAAIKKIAEDDGLRRRLLSGASKTVAGRDWRTLEEDILALYE